MPSTEASDQAARGGAAVGAGTSGLVFGASAYVLWGLFPAFWPLLEPAGSLEILANRIAWTLVFMAVLLPLSGRWRALVGLSAKGWAMAAAAAVLIAVNWGTYIYGVTSGQVVETALGYFINPLVSMLLGVVVLNEKLRRVQWAAIVLAGGSVTALTIEHGTVPVIAMTLAFSFGAYGLIKKTIPLDTVSSLAAESVVLGPLAIGYLVWWELAGAGTFTGNGVGHTLLLVAAGPVTIVPLLLFGAAARRVPLVTLGVVQYIAPVLQFGWGVLVLREPMPLGWWIGFALVWVALILFTVDMLRASTRAAAQARSAATETGRSAPTKPGGPTPGSSDQETHPAPITGA